MSHNRRRAHVTYRKLSAVNGEKIAADKRCRAIKFVLKSLMRERHAGKIDYGLISDTRGSDIQCLQCSKSAEKGVRQ